LFPITDCYLGLEDNAISLHRILKGKIEIQSRITSSLDEAFQENKVDSEESRGDNRSKTLELIYTPGVAYIAEKIRNNKQLVYDYTSKWNNVAIVCDGTRVLGLGNIGPEGALPIMEGKSVLFKLLGGINAFPLCINSTNKEEIITFIKTLEPTFGAINVEDIESPKVLEIVERLQKELSIPVFHDDQHGTSIITLAALFNALKLVNIEEVNRLKIVIAGAGSAGYGIFRILTEVGCSDIIVTDSKGAIYANRSGQTSSNKYKLEIANQTNVKLLKGGSIADIIQGADVFIGVSGKANLIDDEMIRSMNENPIIFALSNPDPEILPPAALLAGAKIVATGRSDFANQINNAAVFPSVLRALLDLRVCNLTEDLMIAIARSISELVDEEHLRTDYILPAIDDPRILPVVSKTVKHSIEKHIQAVKQQN
jgi:malate dehydrogenase (oxaloacetate-decarboxylating)